MRVEASPARTTRSTSPSGRPPSPASRPGRAPGGWAGRAGTSSARPWGCATWAPGSTCTAAAATSSSRTTRTRSPRARPAGLPFARVWMHNGMIRSEGEKMAKSVGNIFLLREVLDRYDPAVVLMYFLTTHYRSPLEFSMEKLDEAKAAYGRSPTPSPTSTSASPTPARRRRAASARTSALRAEAAREAFAEHMDDDLNTAGAIGELFALVAETYRYLDAVDRGEAPLDAEALVDVATCCASRSRCCSSRCPGAGAGITRRAARSPATTPRPAPPAASLCCRRPARRGGALGRRRAGLRGQARLRGRSLRLRAARPLPRREAVGRRRQAARRDPGGRLRGARHAAGHAGRAQ